MKQFTREEKIVSEIRNNPGIRFRELMNIVGITNGVLSYYVSKLEKVGNIQVQRKSGVSRFFMSDLSEDERQLTKYLRMTTPKKILVVLLKYKVSTFKQIVEEIKMSPSTTSFYLKKLVEDEIITVHTFTPKKYTLVKKTQIENLISEYHPDLVTIASANLEDIFSSF